MLLEIDAILRADPADLLAADVEMIVRAAPFGPRLIGKRCCRIDVAIEDEFVILARARRVAAGGDLRPDHAGQCRRLGERRRPELLEFGRPYRGGGLGLRLTAVDRAVVVA